MTGLARFPALACAAAVAVAAAVWCGRVHWGWVGGPTAVAAGLAGGCLAGVLAARHERGSCRAVLPAAGVQLTLAVRDPVAPGGGRGEARPLRAGCRGAVPVRWNAGPALAAGDRVRVEARWLPREGRLGRAAGTLVVRRRRTQGAAPGQADRLRTALHRAAETLYGPRAPLVHALVLGRGEVDRSLRDAFARSGLAHLLAISGFHVGLVGGWVLLLLSAAGVRRPVRIVVAATTVGVYAVFLGLPPPATRAAALAVVLALQRLRGRSVRRGPLLATCGLVVMVLDPWAVASVGAWLSFAAAGGILLAGAWTRRVVGRGALPDALAASVGAAVATAPITAVSFGTVAVAGLALNLVAVPLAAVSLPAVLGSLLAALAGVPDVAAGFAASAGAGLGLLEQTARWGAGLPFGSIAFTPGPRAFLVAAIPLAGLAWVALHRFTGAEAARRLAWAAAAGLALPLLPLPVGPRSSGLALHFLAVGQGDAALLRTPSGHWIAVDAGPRDHRRDAGREVVSPFLRQRGARRLEALVVSHAHADHLGGVPALLEGFDPPLVVEPAVPLADPAYLAFLAEAVASGRHWQPARPGQELLVDGVRLRVLHPDPDTPGWGTDLNEDSVVLLVEYGCFRAVLTGDAGFPVEARLRGRVGPVALLKVGHHGSRTATGEEWLEELRPAVAVISLGANRYGHPAPATLARLAASDASLWRTDEAGTVSASTDGQTLAIRGARGSRTFTTRLACSGTPPSPPSNGSSSTASGNTPRPAAN